MRLNFGITYSMLVRVYLFPFSGKPVGFSLKEGKADGWGVRCNHCGHLHLGKVELSTVVEGTPKKPLAWEDFLWAIDNEYIETVCPNCRTLQTVSRERLYYRDGETWKNLATDEELSEEELLLLL